MIVISGALALTLSEDLDADLPVILWRQIVTAANVAADSAAAGYPATNLANPATHLKWLSASIAEQLITIDQAVEFEIDAVGIARHNFGSGLMTVSVEALIAAAWVEVVEPFIPPDDRALLILFEAQSVDGLRLRLLPAAVAPTAAVLFAGKSLRMERGVQPHTPLVHARSRDIYGARSVSGEYLGQVVLGEELSSSAVFKSLTPAWYRAEFDEFVEAGAETPFFFAWKPDTYPYETGFAWLASEARPQVAHLTGLVDVTLDMSGLAL